MNMLNRRQLLGTAAGLWSAAAFSQAAFPNRTIRLVVPSSAGGGTDVLARTLAEKLAQRLGQPVVVENKPGANGIIGAELVAHAPADGYTLLVSANNAMAANVSLYRKLSYDPVRDFTPIAMLISSPLVLVVNGSSPVKSVPDLIALARSKPGQLNFGVGSSHAQIAGHMFLAMAQIKATPVQYKGPVAAITSWWAARSSSPSRPCPAPARSAARAPCARWPSPRSRGRPQRPSCPRWRKLCRASNTTRGLGRSPRRGRRRRPATGSTRQSRRSCACPMSTSA